VTASQKDVETITQDVLARRAGRKAPSTVGELQMLVAEVLAQQVATKAGAAISVSSGGLSESDAARFHSFIEQLKKDGILDTNWRLGDFQDASIQITEPGRGVLQGERGDTKEAREEERTRTQVTSGGPKSDPRKVFVVHGRNDPARIALFTFLRALGLHPLEWSEIVQATGKGSPYIGEVLEKGFSIAQAVVVLMTPDDEARLREPYRGPNEPPHETDLTPQPRPNVLLEGGMALGLFPDRTVIVEIGQLRPVSDIGGRHVIRMNDKPERRQELAQRLQTAGCEVNLSGTDWYKAGSFSDALAVKPPAPKV